MSNLKLWIICGIPGSGKTTLAKKISKDDLRHPKIFEADMYFTDENGNYNWNVKELGAAHYWCYKHVESELRNGNSVIVSNTNLRAKERKPYIKLGKVYDAEIEVITCKGTYQNVHGVPFGTIEAMKDRFEEFNENELN